jgi:hypothetical protein
MKRLVDFCIVVTLAVGIPVIIIGADSYCCEYESPFAQCSNCVDVLDDLDGGGIRNDLCYINVGNVPGWDCNYKPLQPTYHCDENTYGCGAGGPFVKYADSVITLHTTCDTDIGWFTGAWYALQCDSADTLCPGQGGVTFPQHDPIGN